MSVAFGTIDLDLFAVAAQGFLAFSSQEIRERDAGLKRKTYGQEAA